VAAVGRVAHDVADLEGQVGERRAGLGDRRRREVVAGDVAGPREDQPRQPAAAAPHVEQAPAARADEAGVQGRADVRQPVGLVVVELRRRHAGPQPVVVVALGAQGRRPMRVDPSEAPRGIPGPRAVRVS
jgi:broad specificity phosphatase PhoE